MSDYFQNAAGQTVLQGTYVGSGTDTGTNLVLTGTLGVSGATTVAALTASGEVAALDAKVTGLTGAVNATRFVGRTASVAPTTGTFAVGDFVTTTTGRIFVCTVAGTSGTWVEPASVTFAPLASPTFTGTVTVPAAAAVTAATKLNDLSSYLTITSGAPPTFGAWSSGTAQQNPVARQIVANLALTSDATNNAATCTVAISADNVTYTTLCAVSIAAAINNLGALTIPHPVTLPSTWWLKVTFSRIAVATTSYY